MKRFLSVLILLGVFSISNGQGFFTGAVMKDLEYRYATMEIRAQYNLSIYNLLDDCHIIDCPQQPYIAIYTMNCFGSLAYKHIILKKGDSYEVIEMNGKNWSERTFKPIMEDLVDYFKRNPDLPDDLFLKYTEQVIKIYDQNIEEGEAGSSPLN